MSNYIKLEPTGRYGHDELSELTKPGKYSLPVKITFTEFDRFYNNDPSMDEDDKWEFFEGEFADEKHFVDCDVLKVDNTGRYQTAIVHREDTGEYCVLGYNGAENRFKNRTELVDDYGAYEYFAEDAESEIAQEMADLWEKVSS